MILELIEKEIAYYEDLEAEEMDDKRYAAIGGAQDALNKLRKLIIEKKKNCCQGGTLCSLH